MLFTKYNWYDIYNTTALHNCASDKYYIIVVDKVVRDRVSFVATQST